MKRHYLFVTCLLLSHIIFFALSEFNRFNQLIEHAIANHSFSKKQRLIAWRDYLHSQNKAKSQQSQQLIFNVNDYINTHIKYSSDSKLWGSEDFWATPFETIIQGKGDCEDYVIVKYFMLKLLGVPDEQLRFMYVRQLDVDLPHMVLLYFPQEGSEPLVLDNFINEIKPASERKDLEPIYSFNGMGLWLAFNKSDTPSYPVDMETNWVDLIARFEL